MEAVDLDPLTGLTVGITAARRREEFGAALRCRGAAVMYGPAIQIVLIDGRPLALPPTSMSLLRLLAAHPDQVVSRTALAAALTSRGHPRTIQTVVKRGYRVAFDPESVPSSALMSDCADYEHTALISRFS